MLTVLRVAFRALRRSPGLVLAAVALLATWLPARRASRVAPVMALGAD